MFLIFLAVVSLLTGAAAALFLKTNRNRVAVSLVTHAIACALILAAAIPVLLGGNQIAGLVHWSFPVNKIDLRLDPLSAFFLIFSVPMTFLGSLYATGYLAPYLAKKRNAGIHFALLNMVSLSYVIIYLVENAITFLLGWEMAALSAWLLVIWDYRNQRVRFAGFNYLVSTHVGLLFLIAAFMLLHSSTGSFEFGSFNSVLGHPGPYRNITFLLLVTSFALKSAFFPFHTWLPRAHSAAPAHVSALMSGVIHKAGLYGILRFTLLLGEPDEWMGWYLIGFSALSAFMGALYTVTQRDLKRLLGYSSTENVGIAGIGIGLGYLGIVWKQPLLVAFGITGAVLHILNHALFKCLLFYAAGCVYRMTNTVDIERLGGLIKKMPGTGAYFLFGGLAMSGVPLLNGFVSEFLIYNGLLRSWQVSPVYQGLFLTGAAVFSLIGAVSAIAVVRSFGISFLGAPRDEGIVCAGDAPNSMRIPMAIHVVGIAVIGLLPALSLYWVGNVTRQYLSVMGITDGLSDPMERLSQLFVPLSQ
ncbi:MAG: proton-conducting transporter membrane subunit, partial [Bdellovibrionia bacterium]